ncbi:MAG: hypothetical protein AAF721_07235 [Myxococcota bacterium]
MTALEVGDADDDGDLELYSAFEGSAGALIYRSTTGLGIGPRVFGPDASLRVEALAVGPVETSTDNQLYAGFSRHDAAALIMRDADGDALANGFDQVTFAGFLF